MCAPLRAALILCVLSYASGANILGIFPNAGYSQFILGNTLMTELAKRGHHVTVISPFKQNPPIENYTSIVTDGLLDLIRRENLFRLEPMGIFQSLLLIHDFGHLITEYTLSDQKVQNLLHSNEHFDLVICEQFFNEAHYGFAHHFKAPLILFSSVGLSERNNHLTSNPMPLSYIPNSFLGYSSQMSYPQRIINFLVFLFDLVYKNIMTFPSQNSLLSQYFPNPPRLSDIQYNSSLILLNSHPAMSINAPYVPNVIPIGGFHIKPKGLPTDLKKLLDNAKNGAIYFSMGSNLKSAHIRKQVVNSFLSAFSKLEQLVLWKWDGQELEELPKNVKVSKWFPQVDVLAHPNVILFISHGGLLSMTESVYYGKPIIGIPIYGDQKMNIAVAVENEIGISLPFQEISESAILSSVQQVLTNEKYRKNAKLRSRILRDQPIEPLDSALYWIEYTMRYENLNHLKVSGADLDWYQYWMLDVFILLAPFFLAFAAFCMYCAYMFIKWYLKQEVKQKYS